MIVHLPCFGIRLVLEGEKGQISSQLHEPDELPATAAALSAIEDIVLAHALAGVDVSTPGYLEGVETAVLNIYTSENPEP